MAKLQGVPSISSFATIDELALSIREYIKNCENAATSRRREHRFRVAISGGSLPSVLAKALLESNTADSGKLGKAGLELPALGDSQQHFFKFEEWDVFFADERAVPLDHPDSNYKLFKEEILDRLPPSFKRPNVYTIDCGQLTDTSQLAESYEQHIKDVFASRDSVRIPVFDLILLGCGPDGHTCSLFPGSPALDEKCQWVLSIENSPKPPPRRITLSLPVVLHGLNIAFVATGAGKQKILAEIFNDPDKAAKSLPSAMVNETVGKRVTWFTDFAAVEKLKVKVKRNCL